jgi:hypothetical protein
MTVRRRHLRGCANGCECLAKFFHHEEHKEHEEPQKSSGAYRQVFLFVIFVSFVVRPFLARKARRENDRRWS